MKLECVVSVMELRIFKFQFFNKFTKPGNLVQLIRLGPQEKIRFDTVPYFSRNSEVQAGFKLNILVFSSASTGLVPQPNHVRKY